MTFSSLGLGGRRFRTVRPALLLRLLGRAGLVAVLLRRRLLPGALLALAAAPVLRTRAIAPAVVVHGHARGEQGAGAEGDHERGETSLHG
jgi:hypothetical protein